MLPSAVFLVQLLQDVQVLRPLIFMAAGDFGFRTQLLVSDRFRARDTSGLWLNEIESICAESGAILQFFADDWQARGFLTGQGLIFAASESHIQNHSVAHDIFRHAPATYLKVTLQHGFECVGFRHGADHARFYGNTASFAADILCAWSAREHLTALAPSQAPKLVVTGPTSVLQLPRGEVSEAPRLGLVCENLHSVRFDAADKLEREFLQAFGKFAGAMHRQGHRVRLRPHPGGQYSARPDRVMPRNVQLENAPLYRVDLRQFAYGISPPSSVLIDMLLADIPTAIWRDWRGRIDLGNFVGLPTVSSADEMIGFAHQAMQERDHLVSRQRQWLGRQGMPLEPAEVYARYAKLFETAERMEVRRPGSRAERERILLVDYDSTQSKPDMQEALTALTANGEVVSKTVSFRDMAMPGHSIDEDRETERQNVRTALQTYDPSVIFLFGGDTGDYQPVLQWAQSQHAAVIYFLDLPAPALVADGELPEVAAKWELLHGADVVFVPTEDQKVRLERTFPKLKTIAVPAAQQVSQNEQSAPELRKDLLRLIAVGRATAGSKARQAQKEVQVCHSR